MKLTFILITFFASVSFSKTFDLSNAQSKVEFLAVGKPSMLKILGKGAKLSGNLSVEKQKVAGVLKVLLSDLTTGINLRDEHMKTKYLETAKFPEAELEIQELMLSQDVLATATKLENVPFKGILKIRGVSSPVDGIANIQSTDKDIQVKANTKTSITAHKIDLPAYLGIKVADEISVTSEFTLQK